MQGGTLNCQSRRAGSNGEALVAKGEIPKAAAESGVPGFNFMLFMVKLPFLILHILSIPVKPFGCGYAALRTL